MGKCWPTFSGRYAVLLVQVLSRGPDDQVLPHGQDDQALPQERDDQVLSQGPQSDDQMMHQMTQPAYQSAVLDHAENKNLQILNMIPINLHIVHPTTLKPSTHILTDVHLEDSTGAGILTKVNV